jgi:hypothetical protein
VPDEDIVVLKEMAEPPGDKGDDAEGDNRNDDKPKDGHTGTNEELTDEEKEHQKKRELYKGPRNKLVREWHESNERAAAAEARNEILEQELEELRNKSVTDDDPLAALKEKEAELLQQRNEAEGEADLALYSKVNDEYQEVRFKRMQAESDKAPSGDKTDTSKDSKTPEKPSSIPDEDIPQRAPAADAWIKRNQWFYNPDNAHLASYAERVEAHLRKSGMELGDELYQKLDETLAAMPEFDGLIQLPGKQDDSNDGIQDEDDEHSANAGQSKPRHLLPPTPPGTRRSTKPKPGELTAYDKQTMRRFNLDPENVKHKAAYLKRKSKGASK